MKKCNRGTKPHRARGSDSPLPYSRDDILAILARIPDDMTRETTRLELASINREASRKHQIVRHFNVGK